KTIHLVMDNLNIHCRKSLTDAFGEQMGDEVWSRFTVHYTPAHGSWLNQAEIEIGLLSRQCLGRRAPLSWQLCGARRAHGIGGRTAPASKLEVRSAGSPPKVCLQALLVLCI